MNDSFPKGENILLYAREPVGSGLLFRDYGDKIIKDYLHVSDYKIISDFPQKCDYYIDTNKYSLTDCTQNDFYIIENVLDIDYIIKNDRVFRMHMSYYDSSQLIFRVAKYLIDFFKKNQFDVLVTCMVDFYIVDILTKLAKHFDVQVFSYCDSFFSRGHIFVTERGEINQLREVEEKEAEEFVEFLKLKNVNPFALSRRTVYNNVLKSYFTYKAKYLYHYMWKHKILGRNEYRFLMTPVETYARSLKNIVNIKQKFVQNLDELKNLDVMKNVYVPLHYHPESTTEYWIDNDTYLTYYPSLIKVIKNFSDRGFNVLVKEHPAVYMKRDKELYDDILAIPNTYLISPFITTHSIFTAIDYVAIWTGTTGIEAIMADKKVLLTETETYFSFGKIPFIGREEDAFVFSEVEKKELARKILGGILPA